jgi:hypothetical protein
MLLLPWLDHVPPAAARCEAICEMLRRQELLAAAGVKEGEHGRVLLFL